MINNAEVQGSIFATPQIFLMWEPNSLTEITPASLEPLTLIHPKPGSVVAVLPVQIPQVFPIIIVMGIADVVLIGTGSSSQPLPLPIYRFFQQHQVRLVLFCIDYLTS
jgi:uncharacterized protein